jgi:DNA repair protein RecO (recombination protein O)
LKKLGMVSNCLRFFEAFHAGTEGIASAHDLLLETMLAVEEAGTISDFFPLLFRARLTFSQGYAPNLSWCAGCGTPLAGRERMFFHVQEGTPFCRRCRPGAGGVVALDPEASAFLTRLTLADPEEWVRWSPSGEVREGCSRFVDAFVQCHLDLVHEENRFFRR